jgi:hypothetical protein
MDGGDFSERKICALKSVIRFLEERSIDVECVIRIVSRLNARTVRAIDGTYVEMMQNIHHGVATRRKLVKKLKDLPTSGEDIATALAYMDELDRQYETNSTTLRRYHTLIIETANTASDATNELNNMRHSLRIDKDTRLRQ